MELSTIRQILILPFVFMFQGGEQIYSTVTVTGLLWKVCEDLYPNDTNVDCSNLNISDTNGVVKDVQSHTGTWQTYNTIANILVLIICIPIIGRMSDRKGRKYVILLGTLSMILGAVLFFCEFYFEDSPFFVMPIVICLLSVFGYNGIVPLSCYAYIADLSRASDVLTFQLTAYHFVSYAAQIITGVLASFFISQLTAAYSLLVPMAIYIVSICYGVVFLKQIPPKHQNVHKVHKELSISSAENPSYQVGSTESIVNTTTPIEVEDRSWMKIFLSKFKSPLRRSDKKREPHFALYVRVLLVTTIIASIPAAGMSSLTTIFCSGDPLNWDSSKILLYKSINTIFELLGMVVSTFGLKRYFNMTDTTLLLITLVSVVLRNVLIGTAINDAMMYVSCAVGMFTGMVQPLLSSLMTQLVEKDEVGMILSIYWFGVGMGQLIASTGLMKLLTTTLSIYPGIVYLFVAGTNILALLAVVWLQFDWKRYKTSVDHVAVSD